VSVDRNILGFMHINKNVFPVPDICRNSSVLVVIIAVEMIVVIGCLSFFTENIFIHIGIVSLYLQWWALVSLVLLCQLRPLIAKLSWSIGALLVGSLLISLFMLIELAYQFYLANPEPAVWFDSHRFISKGAAATISVLVLLRLMVLAAKVERWNKAEAESRIQALQARIQPHFLFNSLNTISELAATDSAKADNAIQALSMLFRVSLEEGGNLHSLEKEIKLCERYVELEMWRVGELVDVSWHIAVHQPENYLVPKLIIQPLLENAIKYSSNVASTDHNGAIKVSVEVSIKETQDNISIKVINPIVEDLGVDRSGNGIAVDNIKERLFVLYDDTHSFKVRSDLNQYQVLIKLPKQAVSRAY
jgi:two-component system sensor histidine kinase AlgZ